MGWFRTLRSWRDAPRGGDGSPATPSAGERFSRPLNFTLDLPPEMTFGGGLPMDGPIEPRIGRAQAMSVGAVKRSRDLICGTLGALPMRVHNRDRQTVPNVLFEQPEPDTARSVTMTRIVEDLFFEGRAWLRITEFGWHGYPTKVRRLEPRAVNVQQNAKVYVSSSDGRVQGGAWEWVPDAELIRIDSPNDPLLTAGARAIRTCLLLDRAAARYASDPLPLGYFAPAEGAMDPTPDEVRDLLDEWEEANRSRSWGYVGAALRANVLQWNPEQLQLAQARDTAVLEISRICGLDPEDLGVSTTTRTYQNAEQRRLDMLDFTLKAYVTAIEDRLSMGDVLPRGHFARFQYEGFLRSDTLTRMQVYEIGRRVGVYNDERIAELEDIPSARPQKPPAPAAPPPVEQAPPAPTTSKEDAVAATAGQRWHFTADGPLALGFDLDAATAQFTVDSAKRTVSGVAVPWGAVARSGGRRWRFAKDSLHWGGDASRVKLNRDHDRAQSFGYAATLESTHAGLVASFRIGRGAEGDAMLALAEDHVYDGFSIEVDFEPGDGWEPDPTDETVCLVHSGTLRAVALTAMPAFDGARVAHVAATREETTVSAPAAPAAEPTPAEPAPAAPAAVDFAQLATGLSESIRTAVAEAFANLPQPQGGRQVIPAGEGAAVVREPLVYRMDGNGHSMVRDAWKARTEGDVDARDRLNKFSLQLTNASREASEPVRFGANTGNAAAVIPPGYRPDLYVTQLMQGRPLWSAVSRGTLTDATPFTIPAFGSASGMTGNHTEGTNPTGGTLVVGTKTVSPGAVSGLFSLTREIVDSANPAIDAIATQAMQESYTQQTEAKLYAELNGPNGQGGAITGGFVPSGAQVSTTKGGSVAGGTLGGEKLIMGSRAALAAYPFRRFGAPNRMFLSAEGTSAFATALDNTGRPLLPSVGAQNTVGVGNAVTQGWYVDGLAAQPAWSMSGNAAGDADVLGFNSNDVWAWESPLLTFRFEERGGPANIDLALFGYVACRVLRPVGVFAVRHTVDA